MLYTVLLGWKFALSLSLLIVNDSLFEKSEWLFRSFAHKKPAIRSKSQRPNSQHSPLIFPTGEPAKNIYIYVYLAKYIYIHIFSFPVDVFFSQW